MTDELTDAEFFQWLRWNHPKHSRIAERLEQLAAENANLNSRLAELQGRYFAAVKNNEALAAERDRLRAENEKWNNEWLENERLKWRELNDRKTNK